MKKLNKWILVAGITVAPFAMMAGPHHPEPHRGDAVVNLVGNCIGLAAEVLRIGTPAVVVTPVVTYVEPAYYAAPPPPPHRHHAPAPPHHGGHNHGGHGGHGGHRR